MTRVPVGARRFVRRAASESIKSVAAIGDRLKPGAPSVSILAYHRVGGGSGSVIDLPVATFRRQMEWLSQHRRVVDLDTAVDLLEGNEDGDGSQAVALTFDDGTADFADVVTPLLVEFDLPATVYVATSFIAEDGQFPWGAPAMSWSEVSDVASSGLVSVESHSHRHLVMDKVDYAEVADDLRRCDELIATHVGRAPRHFAYPKGVLGSAGAARAVRERYRSAAGGRVGGNVVGATDPQVLRRSPIQTLDRPAWFRRKVDGGLAFEGEVRERLNKMRYRRALT